MKKWLGIVAINLISRSGLTVLASNIFFSPDNGNLLMYCSQSIAVEIQNPDTTLSAIDMILQYSGDQVQNTSFSVNNPGEYSVPFVNEYNNELGFDSWKFGGSRLLGSLWPQDSNDKLIGNFLFKNKSGVTSLNLDFYALPDTTAGDTNLAYQGTDFLTVPGGVGSAAYNFITGTCIPDTKAPEIPDSEKNIDNFAYRVDSAIDLNFRIIDQSSILADFWYPSDDFGLSNYVPAPSYIDNQYGVNSGTITVKIKGDGYQDEYMLNGLNDFDTIVTTGITWHREDKGYDIMIDPLRNFGVEEGITITIQGYDNTHISKPTAYLGTKIFSFNQPKAPIVVWSSLANRQPTRDDLVDPELDKIVFRVQDDWAGVDSGSLEVYIMTGNSIMPNGGLIKKYENYELFLSGITMNFPSNGLKGSNGITHSYNYDITLTGFGPLPENSTIWVVVAGFDMADRPNSFSPNSFHFQTRQSCSSLQCGAGVNIFTGNSLDSTLYLDTELTVTGGLNPMISGEYLYCIGPEFVNIDLYTGGVEISSGNMTSGTMFYDNFSGENLVIEVIGGTAELIGNTLYVSKSGPTCGNGVLEAGEQCDDGNIMNSDGCNAICQIEYSGGGGGGGASISKDDCQLPESDLPGANWEGIDYSDSYYDRTCEGDRTDDEDDDNDYIIVPPECEIGVDNKDNIVSAYKYACELDMIDDYPFDAHFMEAPVLRKELAQMVVEYATKILMLEPDPTRVCVFNDVAGETESAQNYMKLACQLGVMGLDYDGTPTDHFDPNGFVTEAQFAAVFSRMLRGDKYNTDAELYYRPHADALLREYIIDDFEPDALQTRIYVMDMMRKTDRSIISQVHEYQPFMDTQNICSVSPYGEELEEAYIYACNLRMTTRPNIEEAEMYEKIYRVDLAKMISVYAITVLGETPDHTMDCTFTDIGGINTEMQYFMVTACELGLMGLNYDGTPLDVFMPYEYVSRAQFLTILSRLIWEGRYNGDESCRYCPHANALNRYGVVKDIENPTERDELRGFVMLMMYRAKDIIAKAFGQ